MERRSFLKKLGIGTAVALGVPSLFVDKDTINEHTSNTVLYYDGELVHPKRQISPDGNWEVSENGDILFVGKSNQDPIQIVDLHRQLQEMADDVCANGDGLLDITSPNPSKRYTDHHIELCNGLRVEEKSIVKLVGGHLKQIGKDGEVEYYASMVSWKEVF